MDAKEKIELEKLENILNPELANRRFKITLRFQYKEGEDISETLDLARKNRFFMEEGSGQNKKYYASFYPEDARELHRLFDLVEGRETTRIYLNNKLIPYVQDLWLFLMWFYTIK